LNNLGKYTEAISAFDEALKSNPKFTEAWMYRGFILSNLHKYEEALFAYNATLKIDPKHAGAWECKGQILFTIDKYAEALSANDEARSKSIQKVQKPGIIRVFI
jgi:tetratricopeptide (TPR) repeat protein